MGLFHATCCISNLPIRQGEPARLVFLVRTAQESEGASGLFSGWALWTPWSLPLKGVYDGYGRLKIEDGWHPQFIRDRLSEVLIERDEGTNHFVDPAIRKEGIAKDTNLERLQDFIARDRVRVFADVDLKEEAVLGMTFIREDVYQALVEAPAFTEDSVMTADATVAEILASVQSHKPNPLFAGQLEDSLKGLEGTALGNSVAETLTNLKRYMRLTESVGSYGPPGIRGIGSYRLHASELVMAGLDKNDPRVVAPAKGLGEFTHLLRHFEFLRKLWTPCNGSGSQHMGWGSHVVLAKLVHQVAYPEFEAETERYEDPAPPPSKG